MDNKKGGYIIADLPSIDSVYDEETFEASYEVKPFDYDTAMSILNSNVLVYVYINGKAEGFAGKNVYKNNNIIDMYIKTTWIVPEDYFYGRYYIIKIDILNKTATVSMADLS